MDFRKIKKLIEILKSTGIAEIEINEGKESVRIRREDTKIQIAPKEATVNVPSVTPPAPKIEPADKPSTPTPDLKKVIKAPMVGMVYFSPSPEAKPFVEVGQNVKVGEVVCLIEAMKMFNQIEADRAGKIIEKLVENGSPVEYNQPIFRLE